MMNRKNIKTDKLYEYISLELRRKFDIWFADNYEIFRIDHSQITIPGVLILHIKCGSNCQGLALEKFGHYLYMFGYAFKNSFKTLIKKYIL